MFEDGDGVIEVVNDEAEQRIGTKYKLFEGACYALDESDKHYLYAGGNDCHLICIFRPGLVGDEIHDEDGAYPITNGNE